MNGGLVYDVWIVVLEYFFGVVVLGMVGISLGVEQAVKAWQAAAVSARP